MKPQDTIENWIAFDEAYSAFVKAHPMLGLGDNAWASINLRRNFGARLLACGAVRQLPNRRWLAHREDFGLKLFALLTRSPVDQDASAANDAPAPQRQGGAQP